MFVVIVVRAVVEDEIMRVVLVLKYCSKNVAVSLRRLVLSMETPFLLCATDMEKAPCPYCASPFTTILISCQRTDEVRVFRNLSNRIPKDGTEKKFHRQQLSGVTLSQYYSTCDLDVKLISML